MHLEHMKSNIHPSLLAEDQTEAQCRKLFLLIVPMNHSSGHKDDSNEFHEYLPVILNMLALRLRVMALGELYPHLRDCALRQRSGGNV